MSDSTRGRIAGRSALLLAAVMLLIWLFSGRGYFWPAWVWLGLGTPFGAYAAVEWAWAEPYEFPRVLTVPWTLAGTIELLLLAIWALAGFGGFWPVWPLVGLVTGLGLLSIWVLRDRIGSGEGRRALLAQIESVRGSRRESLRMQSSELREIERDLHDGAQARLVGLTMTLGRIALRLKDRPEELELLNEARRETGHAIEELRLVARGIAPPLLAERGLGAAVTALAARHGSEVSCELGRRLPAEVERAAYFVVAEALTNTAKHAGARRSWVRLWEDGERLRIDVGDDGVGGVDMNGSGSETGVGTGATGSANGGGSGLVGMRTRVRALDGELTVGAGREGGTLLEASVPCG